MKKRSEATQTLAVVMRSLNFSPRCRPLPGGAERPKFNQLEIVITFTYRPSLVKNLCTQFRVIVVTDSQTNKNTHKQTHRQDKLEYTAPQPARSVKI